jgi:hypothetical protein
MKAEEEKAYEILSLLRNPKEWGIFIYHSKNADRFSQRYNTRPSKIRKFTEDEISSYNNNFV